MPLLHHPVLRLADVCAEVVVVVAPETPEPLLPVGVPVRIARDPAEGEGPLAGLYAGLLAAARSDVALVAGGDMPDLATPILLEMLRMIHEAPADAVVLQDGDSFRPLPCAIRTERGMDLTHALLHAGRRSLRDLLGALRVAVIDEPTWRALDPAGGTLRDVDRPEDIGE